LQPTVGNKGRKKEDVNNSAVSHARTVDFSAGGGDEKQIVRMQLAKLFEEIAPKNYKARQWGELQRVRMADNTYRWLCEAHAEEYRR
jgi:hypothetical protein